MKNKLLYLAMICSLLCLCIAGPASAQYRFFSGAEWSGIGEDAYPDEITTKVKAKLLQAAQEAGIFTGTPVISANERNFKGYIADVDSIYSEEAAGPLPLYFALKMAFMKGQGMSADAIERYRSAILQKLGQTGFIARVGGRK